MPKQTKYQFPYKIKDGKTVREGVWVDEFGYLVHVRKPKDNPHDFEYRGQSNSYYIGLRSYAEVLVLRLKDTRQATAFLESLTQKPSRKPARPPIPFDADQPDQRVGGLHL